MGYDVIVVGSGFGGAVVAARLAQRGMGVLVLERGPWWGPLNRHRPAAERREYPRGFGARKLLRSVRSARRGRRAERLFHADGLLEHHLFDRLDVTTGSGVGGGSHIYTSILDEPPAGFFDAYPEPITGAVMRPYFERVRAMLRPAPTPERQRPERSQRFEAAVTAAGLPAPEHPLLAIAWGRDPAQAESVMNAAGVEQRTSTGRVDCLVGCEDGSKTSLDLTYVPLALRHGAELRALCEVERVAAVEGGYEVGYLDHRRGERARERAPRLVLAAGGLNTQRLLFAARDRDRTLPHVSPMLGRRFSPNGDLMSLVWRARGLEDSARGPAFEAFSRVADGGRYRFLLGEVGLPTEALPLPDVLRAWLRRSVVLLCMGRDASDGTIEFDGEGLTTAVGRELDPALYDEMQRAIDAVARHYEPRAVVRWPRRPGGLSSVHPLGGCAMADTPAQGVTDHRGEVFGHPNLHVADGSLYPRAPGIPPSLTIAALAERQAELIA